MKIIEKIINNKMALLKILVFMLSLIPLFIVIDNIINNNLTANPIEYLIRFFGKWSLNFLVISLLITPLRKIFKLNFLIKFRRMMGLFSFFYLLLHFGIWLGLDQSFDMDSILNEIQKRQYILVGFLAFLLMIPLALTSFNKAIKFLGGSTWNKIHKLIYFIGILSVVHYYWIKSSKHNLNQPLFYISLVLISLLIRIFYYYKNKKPINA